MIPISCDECGFCDACRFEYIDPAKHDLPMLFCSIDCLTKYVEHARQASEEPSAKGVERDKLSFH